MRKRSRKTIVKGLDTLARTLLRLKQNDTCEYCGAIAYGSHSHPHHIRSRKWYNTRWRLENLVLLCAVCHRAYHDGNIGKDWFKEKHPECWKWLENKKAEPIRSWKDTDLIEVEIGLKSQIEQMPDQNGAGDW